MSSIRFVLDSGSCVAAPGRRPVNYSQHRGQSVARGQICSACLVGTWPSTQLRSQQHVCASCADLGDYVATALQASWPLEPRDDVRAASLQLRSDRLAQVFDEAAAGANVAATPDGIRELSYAAYQAQVAHDAPSRVRRFASWVAVVSPAVATDWHEALADVDQLTEVMHEHHRKVQRGQARVRLERASTDLRAGVRGFGTAAPAVLRAVLSRRA